MIKINQYSKKNIYKWIFWYDANVLKKKALLQQDLKLHNFLK